MRKVEKERAHFIYLFIFWVGGGGGRGANPQCAGKEDEENSRERSSKI